MKFTHGIVAACPHTAELLHFVGFLADPGPVSYLELYRELKTDESLGMVGTEFILIPAPSSIVDLLNENSDKMEIVVHDGKHNEVH